jgi:hypothetical protein
MEKKRETANSSTTGTPTLLSTKATNSSSTKETNSLSEGQTNKRRRRQKIADKLFVRGCDKRQMGRKIADKPIDKGSDKLSARRKITDKPIVRGSDKQSASRKIAYKRVDRGFEKVNVWQVNSLSYFSKHSSELLCIGAVFLNLLASRRQYLAATLDANKI